MNKRNLYYVECKDAVYIFTNEKIWYNFIKSVSEKDENDILFAGKFIGAPSSYTFDKPILFPPSINAYNINVS